MTDTLLRLLRRFWPLLVMFLVVALVRESLNHREFDPTRDTFDARLLFGVGIVISISVLLMLATTENWTLRACGVFGLILFDSLLYGLNGSVGVWHWWAPTQKDLNWLRALIIVAALLLLTSQVLYLGPLLWGRIRRRWRDRT